MVANPRIEELRRRVHKDPASIAFAQLAEEYRRAGSFDEAIAVSRAGLLIHPGYLSARVTLGRALIEVDDLDAAEPELESVLRNAPENLAAIRGLAEIHHRRGQLAEALNFYQSALGLAKHDPDLEQIVEEISRVLTPESQLASAGMSVERAAEEPVLDTPVLVSSERPEPSGPPTALPVAPVRVASPLVELERFLGAIHAYRRLQVAPDAPAAIHLAVAGPAPNGASIVEEDSLDLMSELICDDESFDRETEEFLAASRVTVAPYLIGLERFLDAIQTYRQRQAV